MSVALKHLLLLFGSSPRRGYVRLGKFEYINIWVADELKEKLFPRPRQRSEI